MPRKTKPEPPAIVAAPAASASPALPTETALATRATPARAAKTPRNRRELAQAIFEQRDAVTVGRDLLDSDGARNNSVKARVWETLVDFLFGKPPAGGGASSGPNVQIVWDLPGPPHETNKS